MFQLKQNRPRLVGASSSPVQSLALSRDASRVAVGCDNGALQLWTSDSNQFRWLGIEGKAMVNPNLSAGSPVDLRFSPDDATLFGSGIRLAANNTSSLFAWDAGTRKIKWSQNSGLEDDMSRFWPSNDGKRVLNRSYDVVKMFDVSKGGTAQPNKQSKFARAFPVVTRFRARIAEKGGGTSLPQTVALSSDGKTIIVAGRDGHLEFWNAANGQKQSQTPAPKLQTSINHVNLLPSPDGRFVALFDGTNLSLWNVAAKSWARTTIVVTTSYNSAMAWMPDSRSLWLSGDAVQQLSVPELQKLRELPIGGPLALSGDGKTLATRNIPSNGVSGVWLWNVG